MRAVVRTQLNKRSVLLVVFMKDLGPVMLHETMYSSHELVAFQTYACEFSAKALSKSIILTFT